MEVGIFVDDLEATSAYYSNIFLAEASQIVDLDHFSLRTRDCHTGNVYLKLMEITKKEDYQGIFHRKQRPGLNHVTLKVKNIDTAISYLTSHAIDFMEDPVKNFYDSRSVFIHPKELSGTAVFLTDEFLPLP